MKKIICAAVLIFTTTMAYASVEENVVALKYNKPINGLKIEALWKPETTRNGYARGPAIIQLTDEKSGSRSTVAVNYFTMTEAAAEKFIEWKKDQNKDAQVKKILSKTVNLEYTDPEISEGAREFGTLEEPFFFYDLNFDGKKEFLVGEAETGQRWRATFKAYELDDSEYFVLKEPAYQQITYQEPYLSLDSAATVNRENKTITINHSAGALDSSADVYKAYPEYEGSKTNEFVLERAINSERDAEVTKLFNLNKEPFIHPAIIKDLSTHNADWGDQVISINLLNSQDSDRYFGDVEILNQDTAHPVVCYDVEVSEGRFCYKYVGELDDQIFVVKTSESTGGSGVWTDLLLLSFSEEKSFDFNFDGYVFKRNKEMYLINRLGSLSLGDRFDTNDWKVEGNKIFIGKDTGWFSVSGGTGGGWLSHEEREVVITVDLEDKE